MFFSGSNRAADSRRSLGLGLALCRSIITAHGGTISLSQNQPHGAVFRFTLPAEEVQWHDKPLILAVEDDRPVRTLIATRSRRMATAIWKPLRARRPSWRRPLITRISSFWIWACLIWMVWR